MKAFTVSANGTEFGTYVATDEAQAIDLCARDAGYENAADMVARLGGPCELVAVEEGLA